MPTPSSQLSSVEFTHDEVYSALMSLDISKACGYDGISAHFIKLCACSLSEYLADLFNLSLSTGSIPSDWKIHQIVPIFKAGNRHNVENYRPISLLCIISKVLESLVYSKVIHFVKDKLCDNQFGFLPGRSSASQLLLSFSSIFKSCDQGRSTDQIFLDFRKAFDSIPHSILLYKLWAVGITGPLWQWFRGYLNDRKHFVKVNSYSSQFLTLRSGVSWAFFCISSLLTTFLTTFFTPLFICSLMIPNCNIPALPIRMPLLYYSKI
jgi:sarcosine oxidase/L-pipecolate oxidase